MLSLAQEFVDFKELWSRQVVRLEARRLLERLGGGLRTLLGKSDFFIDYDDKNSTRFEKEVFQQTDLVEMRSELLR